jgi:hypothetical protein
MQQLFTGVGSEYPQAKEQREREIDPHAHDERTKSKPLLLFTNAFLSKD